MQVERFGRERDLPADDSGSERAEDAEQHRSLDAERLQHGDKDDAEDGELHGAVVQVAEFDQSDGVAGDDAGAIESDERDKEADASGDGGVELVGDGSYEALADAAEGEQQEDDGRRGRRRRARSATELSFRGLQSR